MTEQAWGYELTILFANAFRMAVEELHDELAKIGFDDVRPSHGFIFQRISHGGATGNELADHLGITKQAASLTIDYLERQGYVSRQPHPSDRRGKLVVLTERGWACIRETERIFSAIESRWEQSLGQDKVQALRLNMRELVGTFPNGKPGAFRPVW
ncbi:MarR family winged helix-turn-helix transcriptional regulator [Cohnella nanjingensis]|uniref:Winged helix-turn-helix transcriptional regulator n=1 Tax=Cohnella nanjingensis TaxID=1387779 RepID=A0A7X0RQQ9_9BACL|nr:MarR family winged helix-turn-helix transcriptional regulator [Cohnella nanjingensis]MBB6671969.1 winged helix-turn-helix transcriptional regulator [Cohnella nanjingensis]